MGIFKLSEGWWACRSETDPRWNMEGRGYVGLLSQPEACKRAIEDRERELGEEPPEDLEWSYMKD